MTNIKLTDPTQVEIAKAKGSNYLHIEVTCPLCSKKSYYKIHEYHINNRSDSVLKYYTCSNSGCTQKFRFFWEYERKHDERIQYIVEKEQKLSRV